MAWQPYTTENDVPPLYTGNGQGPRVQPTQPDDDDEAYRLATTPPIRRPRGNNAGVDIIRRAGERAKVAPEIIDDYLHVTGGIESGNDPNVKTSIQGARGIGQVMPDRGQRTVRTINGRAYDLTNPDENAEAGVRLFAAGGADPVGRRLEYFGGYKARRAYERTGRIPNIKDGLKTTGVEYIRRTMPGGQRPPVYQKPQKPVSDEEAYQLATQAPASTETTAPATAPGITTTPAPQSRRITGADFAWHLGVDPTEIRSWSRDAQRRAAAVVAAEVANDEAKRAAGQSIGQPDLKYQNQMRERAKLPPIDRMSETAAAVVRESATGAPQYVTRRSFAGLGEKPKTVVREPFRFGEQALTQDEQIKSEIRAKVETEVAEQKVKATNPNQPEAVQFLRSQGYIPGSTTYPGPSQIEEETEKRFQQYKDEERRRTSALAQTTKEVMAAQSMRDPAARLLDKVGLGPDVQNVTRGALRSASSSLRQLLNATKYSGPALTARLLGTDLDKSLEATREFEAGLAEQAQETEPTTNLGQFRRGLGEAGGALPLELTKLIGAGKLLDAAKLPAALNLPIQGALGRADEGPIGLVKGAAGGLMYHYGGTVTGPYLGKVGNALLWIGAPAAEAHLVNGVPWAQAISENVPFGLFAGVTGGGNRARVFENGRSRIARVTDVPSILSGRLKLEPPPQANPTAQWAPKMVRDSVTNEKPVIVTAPAAREGEQPRAAIVERAPNGQYYVTEIASHRIEDVTSKGNLGEPVQLTRKQWGDMTRSIEMQPTQQISIDREGRRVVDTRGIRSGQVSIDRRGRILRQGQPIAERTPPGWETQPGEKAAAAPTEPVKETAAAIRAQIDALESGRGSRAAVEVEPGTEIPPLPPSMATVKTEDGRTIIYPKDRGTPDEIKELAEDPKTAHLLLGHLNADTPEATGTVVARAGRDVPEMGIKAGDELMRSRVTAANEQAMMAELKAQFPSEKYGTIVASAPAEAPEAAATAEAEAAAKEPAAPLLNPRFEGQTDAQLRQAQRDLRNPPPFRGKQSKAEAKAQRSRRQQRLEEIDAELAVRNQLPPTNERFAELSDQDVAERLQNTQADLAAKRLPAARVERARRDVKQLQAEQEARGARSLAPRIWRHGHFGDLVADPTRTAPRGKFWAYERKDPKVYHLVDRNSGLLYPTDETAPVAEAAPQKTGQTITRTITDAGTPAPAGQLFGTAVETEKPPEPTADQAAAAKEPVIAVKPMEKQNALRSYLGNKISMAQRAAFNIIPTSWRNRWKRVVDVFGGSGIHGWQIGKALGTPVHYNEYDANVFAFQKLASNVEGQEKLRRVWLPIADEISAMVRKYPDGGSEAHKEVSEWWKATQGRLSGEGATPEQRATRVLLDNTMGTMGDTQALMSVDHKWKKDGVNALATVTTLLERHRLNAQQWEGTSNQSAEELLPTLKKGDLAVLDPPYALTKGYKVGQNHESIKGATDFIKDHIKPAVERGVSVLYTNAAHPDIVGALRAAGMEVKLERVRTQTAAGKEAGERFEVVGWTPDVSPPRGTDAEVLNAWTKDPSLQQADLLTGKTAEQQMRSYVREAQEDEKPQAVTAPRTLADEPPQLPRERQKGTVEYGRKQMEFWRQRAVDELAKATIKPHISGRTREAESYATTEERVLRDMNKERLQALSLSVDAKADREMLERAFPEYTAENLKADIAKRAEEMRAEGATAEPAKPETAEEKTQREAEQKKAEQALERSKRMAGKVPGVKATNPQENSLAEKAAARGGVWHDRDGTYSGEVRLLAESKTRGLVREGGRTLEDMAMTLAQDGYGYASWARRRPDGSIDLDLNGFIEALSQDATHARREYSNERTIDKDVENAEREGWLQQMTSEERDEFLQGEKFLGSAKVKRLLKEIENGDTSARTTREIRAIGKRRGIDEQIVETQIRTAQETRDSRQRARSEALASAGEKHPEPAASAEGKGRTLAAPSIEPTAAETPTAKPETKVNRAGELLDENGNVLFARKLTTKAAVPELAKSAEWKREGRRIVANEAAQDLIGKVWDADIAGAFMKPGQVRATTAGLSELARSHPEVKKEIGRLIGDINKAASTGREGTIVLHAPTEEARAEEEFHRKSWLARGGDDLQEGHADFQSIVDHPAYESGKDALLKQNYPDVAGHLVDEMAARAINGRHEELGWTPEQAKSFAYAWWKSIMKGSGERAVSTFEERADESNEAREAYTQAVNEYRAAADKDRQEQTAEAKPRSPKRREARVQRDVGPPERIEPEPRFLGGRLFSQLYRTIMSQQATRASVEQLRGTLANPDNKIKADEMKWSGLDDFLKDKDQVKRKDVLDFLRGNALQLKEDVRGEPVESKAAIEAVQPVQEANTRYGQYTVPGAATNYREIVFTLPPNAQRGELGPRGWAGNDATQRAGDANFTTNHWPGVTNPFAHTRVDERITANRRKMFFVNEVQSDLHQKARKTREREIERQMSNARERLDRQFTDAEKVAIAKKVPADYGYRQKPYHEAWKEWAKEHGDTMPTAENERAFQQATGRRPDDVGDGDRVPPTPFSKSWPEFVMRRLVHEAASRGFDYIGWATGDQVAEYFDLSKQVRKIEWVGSTDARTGEKKTHVIIDTPAGLGRFNVDPKTGKVASAPNPGIFGDARLEGQELADVVGKDRAQKILETKTGEMSGSDLRVGGKELAGMRGFYDKMILDYMRRFGRKFGAEVKDISIGGGTPRTLDSDRVGVMRVLTQMMEEAAANGNEEKQQAIGRILGQFEVPGTSVKTALSAESEWGDPSLGNEIVGEVARRWEPQPGKDMVHALEITPEMRRSIAEEGLPLFKRKPGESEAEHDARLQATLAKLRGRNPSPTEPQKPAAAPLPPPERIQTKPERGIRQHPEKLEAAGFAGGTEREYDPITLAEEADKARARVSAMGLDKAVEKVTAEKPRTAQDVALAQAALEAASQRAIRSEATDEKEANRLTRTAIDVATQKVLGSTETAQALASHRIDMHITPAGALIEAARLYSDAKKEMPTERGRQIMQAAEKTRLADEQIGRLRERITDLEAKLARSSRPGTSTATRQARGGKASVGGKAQQWVGRLEQAASEAQARIAATREAIAKGTLEFRAAGPMDPVIAQHMADYVTIGAAKMARKGLTLAEWTAEMVSDFGETVKPHLTDIRNQAALLIRTEKDHDRRIAMRSRVLGDQEGKVTPAAADLMVEEYERQAKEHRKGRGELLKQPPKAGPLRKTRNLLEEIAAQAPNPRAAAGAAKLTRRDMNETTWYREMRQDFGLTNAQLAPTLKEAYQLRREARQSLTSERKMLKLAKENPQLSSPELDALYQQLDREMRHRRAGKMQLASAFKQIEGEMQKAGLRQISKQAFNLQRSLMVSAIPTAIRNAGTQVVRFGAERLTDVVEQVLRQVTLQPKTISYRDILSDSVRIADWQAYRKTGTILEEFPGHYQKLFSRFNADIEQPSRISTMLGIGTEAAAKLNFLNKTQEFHIRSAEFLAKLNRELKAQGLGSVDGFLRKRRADQIPEDAIEKATKAALQVTFADAPPANTLAYQAIKAANYIPPTLSPIPFARYFYNQMKFLAEYHPVGALAMLPKSENRPRTIAKGLVGGMMLAIAYQARKELGGERWYEIRLPGTQTYVDARPFGPFSIYLYQAEMARRMMRGEDPIKSKRELFEVVGASSSPTGTATAAIENLWDYWTSSDESRRDKALGILKREIGEAAAAALTPVRQIKDVISQFDQSQAIRKDTSSQPALGPIRESIPYASGSLPPLYLPTQGAPVSQRAGAAKVFTGARLLQPKNFAQQQFDQLDIPNNTIWQSTGIGEVDNRARQLLGQKIEAEAKNWQQDADFAKASRPVKRYMLKEWLKPIRSDVREQIKEEFPQYEEKMRRQRESRDRRQMTSQEREQLGISP